MLIANVAARRGRAWANLGTGRVARFADEPTVIDLMAKRPVWRKMTWALAATAETVPIGAAGRAMTTHFVIRFWCGRETPESVGAGNVVLSTVPRRYTWYANGSRVALTCVGDHLVVLDRFNIARWNETECEGLGPGLTAFGEKDPPVFGWASDVRTDWVPRVGPQGSPQVQLYGGGDGSLYVTWRSPFGVTVVRHSAANRFGESPLYVAMSAPHLFLLDVSPDGRQYAFCGQDRRDASIFFVDATVGRVIRQMPLPGIGATGDRTNCFGAYSLDGGTFACGGVLGTNSPRMQIRVLDTE